MDPETRQMISDMLSESDSCDDDLGSSFIEESSTIRAANNSNIVCYENVNDPIFDSDSEDEIVEEFEDPDFGVMEWKSRPSDEESDDSIVDTPQPTTSRSNNNYNRPKRKKTSKPSDTDLGWTFGQHSSNNQN